MKLGSKVRHLAQTMAQSSVIALLIVGLMAGSVFAAKGGGGKPGGGSGSMTVQVVTDANANGLPNWGDQVHFTLSTSNSKPIVSLTCSQGGYVVYADSRPYYWPNIWDDPGNFTLSSMSWTSGAADCRAEAKGTSSKGRTVTLASTTFHVDP
jgi:hypothetical protein